jgi:low affinity Fe/Cu permease
VGAVQTSSIYRSTCKVCHRVDQAFTLATARSSAFAGSPATFVAMVAFIMLWAVMGPYFRFSDTWQLVINTSTTIITCLLALLIQASANRSELAIQTKLDELLRIDITDHQKMIGIEHMTLNELEMLRDEIERAAREKAV